MKYSDQQRVNKIYDYASKLTKYVHDNNITRITDTVGKTRGRRVI